MTFSKEVEIEFKTSASVRAEAEFRVFCRTRSFRFQRWRAAGFGILPGILSLSFFLYFDIEYAVETSLAVLGIFAFIGYFLYPVGLESNLIKHYERELVRLKDPIVNVKIQSDLLIVSSGESSYSTPLSSVSDVLEDWKYIEVQLHESGVLLIPKKRLISGAPIEKFVDRIRGEQVAAGNDR